MLLAFLGGLCCGAIAAVAVMMSLRTTPSAIDPNPQPAPPSPGDPACSLTPTVLPIDMHLSMNALNRLALAPGIDERAEQVIDALANYLAAAAPSRDGEPPANRLQRALLAHWQLASSLHSGPVVPLHFTLSGAPRSTHALTALIIALHKALRPHERAVAQRVNVDVHVDDANEKGGQAKILVRLGGEGAEPGASPYVTQAQWSG